MASVPLPFDGPVPESPAPLGRRASERFSVLVPGTLVLLSGDFVCALEDISTDGAKIISDAPLRTGIEGILYCAPINALFCVAWVDGQRAGLEFSESVSLGSVRQLRWNNDCYRAHHDAQLRAMLDGWVSRGKAGAKTGQIRSV